MGAVDDRLQVKVRPGGCSGVAEEADELPCLHLVPDFDCGRPCDEVTVDGSDLQAVDPMLDNNVSAEASPVGRNGLDDDTVGDAPDPRALWAGHVEAAVV